MCPTLPGYPPSGIPEDVDKYDLKVDAGDILTIIDHFKAEKVVVGGHDFGGAVLQALALLCPERIAGLIINSPIIQTFYELVNFDHAQQQLSKYRIPYIEYQPGDDKKIESIVRTIRDPRRRQEVYDYLVKSSTHGMMKYHKKDYPGPAYGDRVDTSEMFFTVPTLILWGLGDESFSLKLLDGLPGRLLNTFRLVTLSEMGH
ncbi:hypothetical protein N7468_006158 [Penicillium chermesinum]|uniref:AB hydrolase-1 domain-containing protein n=1 Tax=Penicillium chermesinum TaxID=63820 RepID=A0A9W9NTX5_9EURO|nr:uncharacterized protein N7468_006158 [Penicillium chermesinum]KAJ5224933.1 hypothetical protein N7468_006158 [Penicillium chermesinum]